MEISDIPSHWVKVSGLNIHYKSLGQGSPVVLVHGGGNDWHEWKENLAFLARSFQVYALDLPGFGLSEPPNTHVSRSWTIAFIKSCLDSLGLKKPHIIGHSMGAMIIIALAADHPESLGKIVLIDSSGLGNVSRKGLFLLSLFRMIDRLHGKKKGPQYLAESAGEWQVLNNLHQIKSPTLIVWGQNDFYLPVTQSKLAQTLIPDSQLHIFPNCGHAPQRECPVKFNKLVIQFLADKN